MTHRHHVARQQGGQITLLCTFLHFLAPYTHSAASRTSREGEASRNEAAIVAGLNLTRAPHVSMHIQKCTETCSNGGSEPEQTASESNPLLLRRSFRLELRFPFRPRVGGKDLPPATAQGDKTSGETEETASRSIQDGRLLHVSRASAPLRC